MASEISADYWYSTELQLAKRYNRENYIFKSKTSSYKIQNEYFKYENKHP